jgi:hypothetical protein
MNFNSLIERDNKIINMEQQLFAQLNKISTELNLEPTKKQNPASNVTFVSVEDALKELKELGVES